MLALKLLLAWVGLGCPEAGDGQPQAVRVVVAGAEEERGQMVSLVEELFGGQEIALELSVEESIDPRDVLEPDDRACAQARAWIELQPPDRAIVFVADGPWERVLVRRLAFSELDAVAREEIGFVVESSVRAVLAGGTIGVERETLQRELEPSDAPEPEPGPVTPEPDPPKARRPWTFWANAGYRGVWAGTGVALHGPRVALGTRTLLGRFRLGASLSGRGYLPSTVERGDLGVRLGGGAAELRADLSLRIRPWIELAVEPAFSLNILRLNPLALADTAVAFSPLLAFIPSGGLALGPEFFPIRARGFRIGLRGVLDFDIVPSRFITADTREVIFAPLQVRPGLMLTVGWETR